MFSTELITTTEELSTLQAAWQSLAGEGNSASVFSSWEWQFNWWQHYGDSRKLRVVVARRDDAVVAILPFYIEQSRVLHSRHIWQLRLVGTGGDTSPDYLSPVLGSEFSRSEQEALVQAIIDIDDWDIISFTDMQDASDLLELLETSLQSCCGEVRLSNCSPIRYISLPDSYDSYLSELSSNQRKQVKRRRRRFEELGKAEFFAWPPDANSEEAFDILVGLHKKRWAQKQEQGSFSSEQYLGFHSAVIDDLQPDNVRLFCLKLEEDIVAIEYSYLWNNTIYSFQCGFDPQYSDYRPGQLLLNYSIEFAINNKIVEFDMLKGDYDYKASAAKSMRYTKSLVAYRGSWAGRLAQLHSRLSAFRQAHS